MELTPMQAEAKTHADERREDAGQAAVSLLMPGALSREAYFEGMPEAD